MGPNAALSKCLPEQLERAELCRSSGQWIECKHSFIRDYWPAFLRATQGAMRRAYVDLYSGPGCNVVRGSGQRTPGSPLIALETTVRVAPGLNWEYPQYPIADFFFNDLDPDAAKQLSLIVATCFPQANVSITNRDANAYAQDVVATINDDTPTFVVLDPEGGELHWSTIEALSRKIRVEALINLPIGGLKRLMGRDDAPSHAHVTRVFGTEAWRGIAQQRAGGISDRDLLDLYEKRLADLGFRVATHESGFPLERVATNTKGVPLYYLIFAAKGPKAHVALNIARGIFKKDCYGAKFLF